MLKDSEPEDLARAIRTVHAGATIIAPKLAQKMLNTFNCKEAAISTVREGVIDVEKLEYRPPREP